MTPTLVAPAKAAPGDRVAVLSPRSPRRPSAPAVHEQALRRLQEVTGLVPVEYPTTRRLDATAADRAADLNAAFGDPEIRAVLATIGGDDQITVIPHLDADLVRARPQAVPGLQRQHQPAELAVDTGVASFHGGSTQVQLGPGPAVDDVHLRSLRAALLDGGRLEITEPGESEDFGCDWEDPAVADVVRRPRADRAVDLGRPGALGDRPDLGRLHRGPPVDPDGRAVPRRPRGARGRGPAAGGVGGPDPRLASSATSCARWVSAACSRRSTPSWSRARPRRRTSTGPTPRAAGGTPRRSSATSRIETVRRYNPDAVVVVGVPFGHTRPQWILPYGGTMTVDSRERRVWADYD